MARASIAFTETERVIAANIRAMREQRRLSQADLAEGMGGGWTATTVSKVETVGGANTRHINADEMVRIAKILDVKLDDLAHPNIAGSREFVAAMRAGEAFDEAVLAAVIAANSAIHRADLFATARREIPAGELDALDVNVRNAYEELLTRDKRLMLDALERVPAAYGQTSVR